MRAGEGTTVSIVMPVYNDEAFVARAVKSCLAQKHQAIEVICVNDASTDGSAAILSDLASADGRVKVVTLDENVGAHNTRLAGVRQTTGDIVTFLDSDDELTRDACAVMAAEFESGACDIVQFGMRVRGDGAKSDEEIRDMAAWMSPEPRELAGTDIVREAFERHTYAFNLCGKAYRAGLVREAFEALGECETSYGEDALAYFAIAYLAKSYRGVPSKRLYVYHLGAGDSGNDKMSAADFERVLTGKQAVEGVRRFLEQQGAFAENARMYEAHRAGHVSFVMRTWYDNVRDADKQACLASIMDAWPRDEVVDLACDLGSDALDVCRACVGDLALTDEQLVRCGYADGYAAARRDMEATGTFRAGRLATAIPRKLAALRVR